MTSHNVEIRSIDLNLAHPSGKYKLTFTFFNNTFKSKEYNLVIQLNLCRKSEKITLSTYGSQSYEYYMNKNCLTNKKVVLQLYSELIFVDDDTDRSNIFTVEKLVNFYRSESINISSGNKHQISLPFNWLFKWSTERGITDLILGEYSLNFTNTIEYNNVISIKNIATVSILKNDNLAAVEWQISKGSFESPFLNQKRLEINKEKGPNAMEWILYPNLHTKRNEVTDKILVDTTGTTNAIFFPFYERFTPLSFNFTFKAEFLYSLEYNINIFLNNNVLLVTGDCSRKAFYCLEILNSNNVDNTENSNEDRLNFNNKDLESFLYNGFNYEWFINWTAKEGVKI